MLSRIPGGKARAYDTYPPVADFSRIGRAVGCLIRDDSRNETCRHGGVEGRRRGPLASSLGGDESEAGWFVRDDVGNEPSANRGAKRDCLRPGGSASDGH